VSAPPQLLHAHVLAGDRLNHVGSGDEHLTGLVDHDHEVGEGGGVHRTARRRAHDDRNLRDHSGGLRIATENLAIFSERHNALLNASAAGIEHPDDRDAGFECEIHDLDDLFAGNLAERAAENCEVLAVDGDLATVNGAGAGNNGVAVGTTLVHAEGVRSVTHELIKFHERAVVEQLLNAFSGGFFALGVLLRDRSLAAGRHRFVVPQTKIGEFPCRREHIGSGGVFSNHAFTLPFTPTVLRA